MFTLKWNALKEKVSSGEKIVNASSGQHKTNTHISFFHFYDNTQPPSFALLFSSLSVITIQLHINTLLPLASVTRFGEISPLCQKFKGLWQSFMDLFSIWQVFYPLWQISYSTGNAKFQCFKLANIRKVSSSGHTASVAHPFTMTAQMRKRANVLVDTTKVKSFNGH